MTHKAPLTERLRAKADEIDNNVARTKKDRDDGLWDEIEHLREAAAEIERQEWINRKLFSALKDMSEFWRYGMAKPDGAELTADDHARVEKLAKDALDALVAAAPDYLSTLPPLECP